MSIRQLLEEMGIRVRGSGWSLCPLPAHLHHNNTPSLSIYIWHGKEYFKCHGICGLAGDIVDFAGYMWITGYQRGDRKLRKQAMEKLGMEHESPILQQAPEQPIPQYAWQMFQPLAQNVREYCQERGVTDVLIEKYRIGSAVRLVYEDGGKLAGVDNNSANLHTVVAIPVFHFRELRGIKLRRIYATNKNYRYFMYPDSKKGLFGYDEVYMTQEPVLIVKGEFAKLVGEAAGYLTCAPTTGEGGLVAEYVHPLILARKILVGDNDAVKMAEKRAKVFDATLKFPPPGFDFDNWLLSDIGKAKETIDKWIEEL